MLRAVIENGPALAAFLERPHERLVVDLGCGDARATARIAARQPGWLVVGVDANLDAAARVLRRARRPASRGGLPNLALIRASADRLPAELAGRTDELRIDLPWGSLLDGLLAGDAILLSGLARLLAPGGRLRIVVNAGSLSPDLTREEAAARLGPALESAGLSEVRTETTALAPETAWAKRLAGGRPFSALVVEAVRSAHG